MASQKWIVSNMPDLSGKTIIVTGGNSGLGFEAVKAFVSKNADVIIACRSLDRGEKAKKEIIRFFPNAQITVMELDLSSIQSIYSFAAKFKKNFVRLDVLLNNAGIMMVPYGMTLDGFEQQLGTNHLGHFALTGLLLEFLRKTPGSRVVNVSSLAHKQGKIDFANLLYVGGKGYTPLKAYGQSKLANLLFTYELQRYFEKNNIDCKALVAHPGVSDTNLFVHIAPKWVMKLIRPVFKRLTQPASMGVLPELRASVDPEAKGSDFFGPDGKYETKGYPVLVRSNAASLDRESAAKLWEASEKLTGVIYN
ncbi:short-chain dehydrogenase/reductase SDR [Paludibacter propionicigenes WB4]|uniref:Short-chain dehydrogenase/reductase SDR n=1 Tax=Paludibacter propionicigenes (strain DSM 17365 / JCM 13257 / WB4) TaxID=694427 RepID=E4T516_PALPW|nr:oxidoreductase [Paludibacter propionicigenes]ADQ79810.1 short-chain dehydrogenase/reductase SDR [Paludibacter propionicigenes WB4]